MCGISGYLLKDLPNNLDLLYEKLEHRGRDDGGIYKTKINGGYLGLYHRRLSIYDLSKNASQPMRSNDGKQIFVFNGSIYNYKELAKKLGKYKLETPKGDSEVLASTLTEWGSMNTWIRSNGMFAIGIFNKETNDLKLIRDRAGQKPLFYTLNPVIKGKTYKGIIFASEIKAISSIIDTNIDKNFLYQYLVLGRVESSKQTLFREIKRLDPGHEMIYNISSEVPKSNCFWNISEITNEIISKKNSQEINERCRSNIEDSVKMQVTGDRKLGIMLSSGVDSTVLASIMRRNTNKEIFSFTYDFKNSTTGESSISRETSNILDLNYIESEGIDINYIKDNLINVVKHQDEPITSIRTVAQHYIHKIAAEIDCRIIIEGNGGDEIFGGYEYYKYASLLDKLQNPYFKTKNILKKDSKENIESLIVGIRSIMIQGICSKDGSESRNLESLGCWSKGHFTSEEYKSIIQTKSEKYGWRIKSQLNDFLSILLPRSLRYVDRASMASGNEARAPLLDHTVIEYGIASSIINNLDDEKRTLLQSVGNKKALNHAGINKKTIVDPQREWLYGDLFKWGIDLILDNKNRLEEYYEIETLLENLSKEKELWKTKKIGNSGSFMQAINLAILLE